MSALEDLQAQVEATEAVEESALKLIQGFADQLQEAGASNGPAIEALVAKMKASASALAAAVVANTPAAATPAPVEVPPAPPVDTTPTTGEPTGTTPSA